MDDLVAQFMAVTSCDAPTAQQYLEASDWQLENAVGLFFASGGASEDAAAGGEMTDEQVRETITGFDDQLVDEESQLVRDMIRDNRRAEARARPRGIFNQARDGELDQSGMTCHEKRLAKLFRPPFDIITDLPLDEAKQKAQEARKLLMVNVQDSGEFACQRLNRDLWRSQQLKDVIYNNFVFLQYDIEDPDGEEYRNLYPFEQFPHIALLDPWTGEQQKVWTRVPQESEFMEDVVDFVVSAQHPEDEDEEEEVKETKNAVPVEVPVTPAEDPVASIAPSDQEEPLNGPDTTRIQLRYGDGKRTVRRFLLSDRVETIYAVAKHVLGVSDAISLTAERRDLKTELEKTISEANLKNSSIIVEKMD